jgi:hypothetical protein
MSHFSTIVNPVRYDIEIQKARVEYLMVGGAIVAGFASSSKRKF